MFLALSWRVANVMDVIVSKRVCIYIFIVFAVFVSIMLAVDGSGEESNNIFCSIYCIYLGEFLCHSICIYIILLVIYKMI